LVYWQVFGNFIKLQSSPVFYSAFKKECKALYVASGVTDLGASGDAALAANEYDRAIELYSAVIDLDSATDMIFANRCNAKLAKMLWEEALVDAQKVLCYLSVRS
jgi:tetratricopeptide (TPR) repeat protein